MLMKRMKQKTKNKLLCEYMEPTSFLYIYILLVSSLIRLFSVIEHTLCLR
jgi:hypothetical protein